PVPFLSAHDRARTIGIATANKSIDTNSPVSDAPPARGLEDQPRITRIARIARALQPCEGPASVSSTPSVVDTLHSSGSKRPEHPGVESLASGPGFTVGVPPAAIDSTNVRPICGLVLAPKWPVSS